MTGDRGVGDPYGYAGNVSISTLAMTFDRLAPQATQILPAAISTNVIADVELSFLDLGTGLTTIQLLIQDVGLPLASSATWVAFSTAGSQGVANQQIWLSTGTGTPQTLFGASPVPPNVAQVVDISSTVTSIQIPHWLSGHQYRISAYASSPAGKCLDTSSGTYCASGNQPVSGGWLVIYDTTPPIIKLLTSPAGLASSSATATYLQSFASINGTYQDNVNDPRDTEQFFVRVVHLTPGLGPGDRSTSASTRWTRRSTRARNSSASSYWIANSATLLGVNTASPWSYPIPTAAIPFLNAHQGDTFRMEVYGADGAGNSTGTATTPLFKQYFRLDNVAPQLLSVEDQHGPRHGRGKHPVLHVGDRGPLAVQQPPDHGALQHDRRDRLGHRGRELHRELLRRPRDVPVEPADRLGEPRRDGLAPGQLLDDAPVPGGDLLGRQLAQLEAVHPELLRARRRGQRDHARGVMGTSGGWTFIYDSSAPSTSALNLSTGTTFSSGAGITDLPSAISGIVNDQINGIGFQPSGTAFVGIGVQRLSDHKWFTTGSPNWQAVRNDPVIPSSNFSGNTWSFSPLGDGNGSFWNSDSTDTFFLYVWTADNVVAPFTNVTSSLTLSSVFQWEVQAPTSTLVVPSTSTNLVWYSTNTGFNLPGHRGHGLRPAPTRAPDKAPTRHCVMPGGPGSWPGGSPNICAEEVEVQDTSSGLCWNGTSFGATCGTASAFQSMSVVASSYSYNTQIGVAGGLWQSMTSGNTYRVRVRGKDAGVSAGGVWEPNVEAPHHPGELRDARLRPRTTCAASASTPRRR